jgi:hypothetical protein
MSRKAKSQKMGRAGASLALWLALAIPACGGDSEQREPAQPQSYAQPEAGSQQPGYYPPPPPPTPQGAPAPKAVIVDKHRVSSERDRSTVEGAAEAFDADEAWLLESLSQRALELSRGGGACDEVCRALGSMRRSVDAICDLAGDGDRRCGAARSRFEGADKRVSDAGCTCSE